MSFGNGMSFFLIKKGAGVKSYNFIRFEDNRESWEEFEKSLNLC